MHIYMVISYAHHSGQGLPVHWPMGASVVGIKDANACGHIPLFLRKPM